MAKENVSGVVEQTVQDRTKDYGKIIETLVNQENSNNTTNATIRRARLCRRSDGFMYVNLTLDKKVKSYVGITDPDTGEVTFQESIVNSIPVSLMSLVSAMRNSDDINVAALADKVNRAAALAEIEYKESHQNGIDTGIELDFGNTKGSSAVNMQLAGCKTSVVQVKVHENDKFVNPFSSVDKEIEVKNDAWYSYLYDIRMSEEGEGFMQSARKAAFDI